MRLLLVDPRGQGRLARGHWLITHDGRPWSHSGPRDQPPRVDGGRERGVIPLVLVRVGRGEVRHGAVEGVPLAEVGGDGDPVTPPGVRAGQEIEIGDEVLEWE